MPDPQPHREERSRLAVRVTPNARSSAFAGWSADEKGRPVLLIKLAAPPVEGKANAGLIAFLSEALGISKGQITLLRGGASRQKQVELPAAAIAKLPSK